MPIYEDYSYPSEEALLHACSRAVSICVSLGMALFLKNVAFHGILLDALFEEGNREWEEVSHLLKEGIMGGVVQPLKTTVFKRDQVENAFRYMAQGKHIGKVVLQVSFTRIFSGLISVWEFCYSCTLCHGYWCSKIVYLILLKYVYMKHAKI